MDFEVFRMAIKMRLSSRQSVSNDWLSAAVKYCERVSKRSQYSVSAVSFKEIWSLEIKSALLTA